LFPQRRIPVKTVLLHEFAHGLIAYRRGLQVNCIVLCELGFAHDGTRREYVSKDGNATEIGNLRLPDGTYDPNKFHSIRDIATAGIAAELLAQNGGLDRAAFFKELDHADNSDDRRMLVAAMPQGLDADVVWAAASRIGSELKPSMLSILAEAERLARSHSEIGSRLIELGAAEVQSNLKMINSLL
jgi:hypothetical protein